MSETKYMFDTNSLTSFFNKNKSLGQCVLLQNKIIVSVISILKFLSFKNLVKEGKGLFLEFCRLSDVVDVNFINNVSIEKVNLIRINHNLTLPDAITAASALVHKAVLITNDKRLSNIPHLQILTF